MRSNILNTAWQASGFSGVRANGSQMLVDSLPFARDRRLMQRLCGLNAFIFERVQVLAGCIVKAIDHRRDVQGNRVSGLPYASGTMPSLGIDPKSGTGWITG